MANENLTLDTAKLKTCSKCKNEKLVSEFHPLKTGAFGVHCWCKPCFNANIMERYEADKEYKRQKMKEYRLRDPEAYRAKQKARRDRDGRKNVRAQQRAWHARNPARKMLTQAKGRAKRFGLEFSITIEDLLPLPEFCPVLGIPLRKGIGSDDANAYSLDRIDNERGYTPDNITVMSRRANVLKRDATPEEIHALARWIDSIQASSL